MDSVLVYPSDPAERKAFRRTCRAIVSRIVGRCNVGESEAEMLAYVDSRLSDKAPDWYRRIVHRIAREEHRKNQRTYARIMGGDL